MAIDHSTTVDKSSPLVNVDQCPDQSTPSSTFATTWLPIHRECYRTCSLPSTYRSRPRAIRHRNRCLDLWRSRYLAYFSWLTRVDASTSNWRGLKPSASMASRASNVCIPPDWRPCITTSSWSLRIALRNRLMWGLVRCPEGTSIQLLHLQSFFLGPIAQICSVAAQQ
jgi:hypothetical protein